MIQKLKQFVWDWGVPLLAALIISFLVRTYVAEAREIPTGSMIPTIKIGDHIWVDKIFYKQGSLERGDIIVFRPPPKAGRNDDFVKRIVGLPGDQVEIKGGIVYINGQAQGEDFVKNHSKDFFGPVEVPAKSYFMMGDNRPNSLDSRYWGFVPEANIKGRALLIYWPFAHYSWFK